MRTTIGCAGLPTQFSRSLTIVPRAATLPKAGPSPQRGDTSPALQADNFLRTSPAHTRNDVSPHGVFSSENVQFCAAIRFCFRRQPPPRRAFPGRFFQEPSLLARKIPGSQNRLADSTGRRASEDPGTDVAATTALGPDRGTATRRQIGLGPTYRPGAPFVAPKALCLLPSREVSKSATA